MFQIHSDLSESHLPGNDPIYISSDGRIGPDPLALAGEYPRFSLSKLALYFATPALVGEFLPDCPWAGVSRLRPYVPWPPPSVKATGDDVRQQFQQSVASCIGDASIIAVAISGGLDSSAVLFHAYEICQREKRQVLALTIDLMDDQGQTCAQGVRQLIDALGISCELLVLREDAFSEKHPWHPSGPRNDAMPQLNRALADKAAMAGAEVLLTGDGADELLGTVRYLLPHFVRAKRWSDARSYLHDLLISGGGRRLTTEMISLTTSWLPPNWRTSLYWATNWPEFCTIQVPVVLCERYHAPVTAWTVAWIRDILTFHTQHHRSWAIADA